MRNKFYFLDEMDFDLLAKDRRSRYKISQKTIIKIALLTSGVHEVISLSENPNELSERLCLIIKKNKLDMIHSSLILKFLL